MRVSPYLSQEGGASAQICTRTQLSEVK